MYIANSKISYIHGSMFLRSLVGICKTVGVGGGVVCGITCLPWQPGRVSVWGGEGWAESRTTVGGVLHLPSPL